MNELINKWEPTSLLTKCDLDEEKIKLCGLLESTIELSERKNDEELMSLIIPLIARIYYSVRKDVNIQRVIDLFYENIHLKHELQVVAGIDAEMEVALIIENQYIKETI